MTATVMEHPARKAGLLRFQERQRVCTSDWMNLGIGDYVREREGRHVGRVRAILNSSIVRVVWCDTGWVSDLFLQDVCSMPGN